MFCKHCGNLMPENAKFCDSCGAPLEQPQEDTSFSPVFPAPSYQAPQQVETYGYQQPRQAKPSVSFLEAIQLYFQGYVDFHGRSRRSEYWYATLFTTLLSFLVTSILPELSGLLSLALFLPSLAICIRRLHDVGRSGWFYLWIFLPIAGSIILLVQFCKDSEGDNQWGPSPKY